MANLNFRFIADTSSMKKGLSQSQNALNQFGNKLKSSFSPANLLGPIAAAASFTAIADAIGTASKAYFEDQKSLKTLNNLIDNNTTATKAQKDALDASIQKMSLASAVADDDLRGAMSKLVVATKDVTKAQDLLQLALDVSAGTGKDLGTVSQALSKAYTGNFGALKKLLPSVKEGAGAFDELKAAYSGAASIAGANDPLGQMNVIMDQLTETLGEQFAPLLKDFGAWLQSPEGIKAIDDFSLSIEGISVAIKGVGDFFESEGGKIVGKIIEVGHQMSLLGNVMSVLNQLGKQERWDESRKDQVERFVDGMKKSADKVPEIKKKFGGVVEIAQRIKDASKTIQQAGKQFADSLKFDEYLNKETNVFDATAFMEKFRGIVAAAKALPAKLKALRKAGASPEVLQQIVAMGPEQGLAVATGFLSNAGSAKEYSKSLSTLNTLGQQAMGNAAGTSNYTINLNKSNMTAEEIISAIQKYEKKTGRKVAF